MTDYIQQYVVLLPSNIAVKYSKTTTNKRQMIEDNTQTTKKQLQYIMTKNKQ